MIAVHPWHETPLRVIVGPGLAGIAASNPADSAEPLACTPQPALATSRCFSRIAIATELEPGSSSLSEANTREPRHGRKPGPARSGRHRVILPGTSQRVGSLSAFTLQIKGLPIHRPRPPTRWQLADHAEDRRPSA